MPARPDLQQIVIDDFSPGIWDDWQAAGSALSAPQGAAQLTGTSSCISSMGGALIPAPRRVNRLLQSIIDASGAGKYPAAEGERMRITSFRALSPVWSRVGVATLEIGRANPFPDHLYFGFENYYKGVTNYVHKQRVRLYKMFLETAANPSIGSVGTYDIISHATSAEYTDHFFYGYTSVDISRSNSAAPTIVGYSIAATMAMSNRDAGTSHHVMFPDDQANGTDSTRALSGIDQPGGFQGYALFAHQDRVCLLDRSINFGMGLNGELPTDMFIAASVNDATTNGVSLENFVAENPGLMGAWCSINASELFLVKQQRGGFVLRGDISFPTVVRLPSLPPTFDAINIPCVAADGSVIYGSRAGVYAWNGGDTAKNISRQLNGWFWNTGEVANYTHTKGQFAPFEGYVAAPNNFLYNTETGSWWRLTDPGATGEAPYAFYDVSAAGYLIGVPAYVSATRTALADYYDFTLGQASYSWKSQPLKASINRVLKFTEVDIKAQGAGTVMVTLIGVGGVSDPVTFTISATDKPEIQSLPIGLQTHDVIVSIIATASDPANAAPRISSVALGYRPEMTARAAS